MIEFVNTEIIRKETVTQADGTKIRKAVETFVAPVPTGWRHLLVAGLSEQVQAWMEAALKSKADGQIKATQAAKSAHPASLEDFCAPGERGGGEALTIRREAIAAFTAWLTATGSKPAAVALTTAALRSASMIVLSSWETAMQDRLIERMASWAATLDAETRIKYASFAQAVQEACEVAQSEDDAMGGL